MDKNEYKIKTEEMLELMEEGAYDQAAEIADLIDWRKVRSGSMLVRVSRIYEKNREFDKSYRVLRIANDRSEGSRKIVYQLCLLALKTGNVDQAIDYYDEFVEIAPKDPNRHILHYMILKAQRGPLEQQIEALEEFKKNEYIEEWGYELARLYQAAGMTAECLDECDELILWFSEGKYVYKAMELKMQYKPLTPSQQEKYDRRYEQIGSAGREEYAVAAAAASQEDHHGAQIDIQNENKEEDVNDMPESDTNDGSESFGQITDMDTEEEKKTVYEQEPESLSDDEANTVEMEAITDDVLSVVAAAALKTAASDQENYESGSMRTDDRQLSGEKENVRAEADRSGASDSSAEESVLSEESSADDMINAGQTEAGNGIFSREMRLEDALRSLLAAPKAAAQTNVNKTSGGDIKELHPDQEVEAGLEDAIREIEEAKPVKENAGLYGKKQAAEENADEESVMTGEAELFFDDEEDNVAGNDPAGEPGRSGEVVSRAQHRVSGDAKTLPVNGEVTELKLDEYSVDEYVRLQSQAYSVRPDLPKQQPTGRIPIIADDMAAEAEDENVEGQFSFDDIFDNWESGKKAGEKVVREPASPVQATKQEEVKQGASLVPPDIQRMIDEIEGLVPSELMETARRDVENKGKEIEAMRIDEPEDWEEEDLEEEYSEALEEEMNNDEELSEDIYEEDLDEVEEFTEAEELDEAEEFGEAEELDEAEEFAEAEELDEAEEFAETEELDEAEEFAETEELDEAEEFAEAEELDEAEEFGEAEELDVAEEFGEEEELDADIFGEEESLEEADYAEDFPEEEDIDGEDFPEEEEFDEEEFPEGDADEFGDPEDVDDDELANWFEDEEPEIVAENFDIFDEFKPVSHEEIQDDDREVPDEDNLIDVMSATTPLSRKETAKLRATGKTAPLPLSEISGALSKSKTGFVVQGRYDLEANSGIGTVAGLTEEQKKIFSYFVPVRGMSEQLVDVLEQDKNCTNRQGTSATGNLLIIGDKGNGKTVLAVDMVKAIHKQRGTGSGKVAIVTGESLNKKRISDIFEKLYGGALIIEKAGKMNEKTVTRLNRAMEQKTGELLVVLEEQRKPLDRLLTSNREFRRKFTSRLEVPIFIDDELVTFGQSYAKENGYFIDEMGILALYSRIDALQREDHFVTIAEIKDIMDGAIAHASRGAAKKLVKKVFKKNADARDKVILTEKDFR